MVTVPLWPVLAHYGWTLPPERSGWQSVRCAIHGEQHASCRVSSDTGSLLCNACGFKGDAITVIQWYEKVDFVEALRIAEGIVGAGNVDLSGGVPGQSSRDVPGGQRDRPRGGRYLPPRLRRRTAGGA